MNYTIIYKPKLIISLLVSISPIGACKSEETIDPQVPLTGKVKQMQFFEGTKLVKSESFRPLSTIRTLPIPVKVYDWIMSSGGHSLQNNEFVQYQIYYYIKENFKNAN